MLNIDQLERAAIIEYEGKKPRSVAEAEARKQLPPRWPRPCACAECVRAGRASVLGG